MELILILLTVQGVMGAFDLVYHHEITEKLTWKPGAAFEMWLHGLRNGLYAVVFLSFGFIEWHGAMAWLFLAVLVVEVGITLTDFVIEDRTRKLPETERVTHTLLALNYGAVLGLFIPVFMGWLAAPTAFAPVYYGVLSWIMAVYALGVFLWFFRDFFRSFRLKRMAKATREIPVNARLAGKRVLVTGGTGFIGRALCRSLTASGARVTVLTRNVAKAADGFDARVELIVSLDEIGTDEVFDAVINLAGEPIAQRWTAKARARIMGSRLGTTKALLDMMGRLKKKPDVFISGSAIGWYGVHDSAAFSEDARASEQTGGVYAQEVCREWEALAVRAEILGVRTVILRTGVVLEKDGGALAAMLFPFDFGFGGPMATGKQWFSWIHRDDLVGIILHSMTDEGMRGAVNGTAPMPVMNGEFAQALGKAMRRPSLIPLPGFVLKTAFGQMAQEIMMSGQRVLPRRAVERGYVFRYPDIKSAMTAIFSV